MTSFATELATPTVTDGVRMDTLLRLIYKAVPTDDVLYCRCNVVTLTMMQSNCRSEGLNHVIISFIAWSISACGMPVHQGNECHISY